MKQLQPWMNYELWSSIEKQKKDKDQYKQSQKMEYMRLLKSQGVDISKVDWSKIELVDNDFDDENNSIEVIE